MTDFLLVDDIDALLPSLAAQPSIGLDTEFMREKTFFAELCLIQIAAGECIFCVDPLTSSGMDRFWAATLPTPWVVHSARQDIEVIYQTAQRMPDALFDTQIAAALLGYAPQIGYAGLVKALFDVEIPKSHTRADWSRRPLAGALLQYAAEDVEYLLPARDALAEQLDKLGRLQWAEQDAARLLDPGLYDSNPNDASRRLKGARNLRGRRRSAAMRLAAWREREAVRANRPRQWIAKDAALLSVAAALPRSLRELQASEALPAGLLRRSGGEILAAVAASAGDDHQHSNVVAPDEAQKALLKTLQDKVARCADSLGLAAEIIAPKKELSAAIMAGDTDSRLFQGWRRDVIGAELQQLL